MQSMSGAMDVGMKLAGMSVHCIWFKDRWVACEPGHVGVCRVAVNQDRAP